MTARRIAIFATGELLLLAAFALAIEGLARAAIEVGLVPRTELRMRSELVVRPHPFLAFCLREGGVRGRGTEAEQHINRQGYRGEAVGPKSAAEFRILCVGDSVMYGDGLAESDTMPARLEELLSEKVKTKKVEVINAGVLQYTSAETLAALALRGLDMRPDVVVFYQGPNDVAPRIVQPFRPDYAHYRNVMERDASDRGDRALERFDGYVTLRWLAGIYPAAARIDYYTVRRLPKSSQDDKIRAFYRSGEAAFLRNEAAGAALARSVGARSLIISTPYNETAEDKNSFLARALEAHHRQQGDVARKQGAMFLDLTSLGSDASTFRDNVHLSAQGARRVASQIAAEMERLQWLPK